MQFLYFCPRWGHAHLSWDELARRAKASGYDGIETDIPETESGKERLADAISKHNLLLIAQHWETVDVNFENHKRSYEKRLELMASVKPLFINSQTGKDFFSSDQNEALILAADFISESKGIPIFHETHRGKFSFAAHVTARFLNKLPKLQLTLDISHWMTVAESFLEDQPEALEIALSRTRHIHARIGYTQGPQVPDPRAPEWQEALQAHLAIWDKVVNANRQASHSMLTITPEFGPPPYMPLLPYTGKTVADQWEINVYMMQLLKKRFN